MGEHEKFEGVRRHDNTINIVLLYGISKKKVSKQDEGQDGSHYYLPLHGTS